MRTINLQLAVTPTELREMAMILEEFERVNVNWYQTVLTFVNKDKVEIEQPYHSRPLITADGKRLGGAQ